MADEKTPVSEREAINYERRPELDKRIANGDDFAGDAWVRWVVPGRIPQQQTPAGYEYCSKCDDRHHGGDAFHAAPSSSNDKNREVFLKWLDAEFGGTALERREILIMSRAFAAGQSLPKSSVSAITARWVPCSERQPDKDGRLWAILTERREQGKHTGYIPLFEYYNFIDGWATDDHVTHWLDADLHPLPRAVADREGVR